MELDRYSKITSDFHKKNIMVIGDLMLDKYFWGYTDRISPEAPVPIVDVDKIEYRPGGAANVALNLSSLGCEVIVVGFVGSDEDGSNLINDLKKHNINTENIIVSENRPTTVKTRIMSHDHQVIRVDFESKKDLSSQSIKKLSNILEKNISSVDGVILQDYNKGVLGKNNIELILDLARELDKNIYVDPKKDNFKSYLNVRLFKPNLIEFESAYRTKDKSIRSSGFHLKNEIAAELLLVTEGSKGVSLFDGKEYYHIPTKARKVHDVSGAGDTVISTFTLSDICGSTPKESAILANYVAGRVCEEVGVIPINITMLDEIFGYTRN